MHMTYPYMLSLWQLGDSFVEVTREDLDKACSATFDKMRKVCLYQTVNLEVSVVRLCLDNCFIVTAQTCKEFLESNNFKREDIAAASLIGGW